MILPVLSAILGILAFLPFDFFWLFGFVFLTPFFIFLLKEEKFWRLVWGTFIFRLVFALGTVYYTLEPIIWTASILIFLGLPVSIFLIKKLSSKLSVISCQLSVVSCQLSSCQLSVVLLLPFLWTFFDHLQVRYSLLPAYIMTSGNSLGSSPFLGLADFGGLIFLTFFVVLINTFIAAIIFNVKFRLIPAVIVTVIIFSAWQISQIQIQKNSAIYQSLKNSLKIAVVSTNENFNYQDLEKIKEELIGKKTDLLILPEDVFNNSTAGLDLIFWQDFAQQLNFNLLITGDRFENNKRYNSTVLINSKGEVIDIYHKNRLTFMGEYWPFKNWRPFYIDWLVKNDSEIRNYVIFNPENSYFRGGKKLLTMPSAKCQMSDVKCQIQFASLICLEIHYPSDLKEYQKMGARFIVNPTSNRWLDSGLSHFLYLTNNLRKIESIWLKMPIISLGVKDFSGLILPDGETNLISFETRGKNYGLFLGEIRY